jgi:hypothetical protein
MLIIIIIIIIIIISTTIAIVKSITLKHLMCSMSVHYIIQKTLNTNECTKNSFRQL